jgi:hypothetical protein
MRPSETAFLGKKFEFQYPISRKDLRKIVGRAHTGQKFKWSVSKATEVVVLGIDPPSDAVEEARDKGLIVLSFRDWFGAAVQVEAQSAGAYLGGLLKEGYRLTTTCNEADGGMELVSLPLLRRADRVATSEKHLARMVESRRNDLQMDVENTLVDWVREHRSGWFDAVGYTEGQHRDLRSFYDPDRDEDPVFWTKMTASIGSSDHGSLIAVSDARILPMEVVEDRIREAGTYHSFCFRCSDAPIDNNALSLILLGTLEKDHTTVSFVPIEMVHT